MGEIKITRKLLDNYRKLKREIPVLGLELAEMEQGEAGLGNSTIFDYTTGFARPQSVVGFDQVRYDRRKHTYDHKMAQAAAVERWIQSIEDGQTRYVFKAFYTFMVKDDSIEENELFAVYYYIRKDDSGELPDHYMATVVTTNYKYELDIENNNTIQATTEPAVPHYLSEIPIIEYLNNKLAIGDFELQIPLIDAYNALMSDRVTDKEQFIDAILAIYGTLLTDEDEPNTEDEDESIRKAKARLKKYKVLEMPDTAKAEYLTRTFDENGVEILKKAIEQDIHKFSHIPCMSDESFGGNVSGVAMEFKLLGMENITKIKTRYYKKGLEVNPEVACIWNDDVNNGFDGMPSGTGNDNDNTSLRKSSDHSLVANKWQRVWFSYTPRTDVSYDIFDASSNWGIITTDAKSPIKFKIRNVKGEFGTVPTDWTPAPEDVDNKIDTAQKSADNANSSVNALNKIATKSYSFGGANGKAQWVRLGTLTSAGDASVVVITLQTGNGFNGIESQNSQAEIIIKDGWQDKASTTAAFGASVTRQNTKDLLVSVRATASNVCEVWTYLPWLYWSGNYTISGVYSGWNPNFTKQDTKPTNGVEQSLAYRTTAEDAYTLASGLKKDVDISSEFVKTYNDWAFKWKTATMVDGAEVGTYQKYITLESGNILLGHSNSKNKLKITNDSIQFKGTSDTAIKPDSDATAWITGKVFHINSGEIESSLKFGKVLMKPTKNGIQIGNKAEFGERVRIGYPLSSNMQYTYSDCPLVVGSNTNTIGDYPWFAVDDGYAFVRNGIITPGDFIIKFGEYTLDRPNGGKFSGTLRPYYRADDVINMEFYVNGYVTSNKQEVIFLIPLSRPIMSTPVSISSINGLTIRQNGKYIYGSTASKPIKPSSYTATVIGGRNGLNVRAKIVMGSNEGFTDNEISKIVNNDTCAITASIKISFD